MLRQKFLAQLDLAVAALFQFIGNTLKLLFNGTQALFSGLIHLFLELDKLGLPFGKFAQIVFDRGRRNQSLAGNGLHFLIWIELTSAPH